MITFIIFGIAFICIGIATALNSKFVYQAVCGVFLATIGIVSVAFTFSTWYTNNYSSYSTTYYLEAEPLAYNYEANLTYFTSTEGQFKTEGIYPENTYLLTMDNNGTSDKKDDIVLVVWEPSEGEVG